MHVMIDLETTDTKQTAGILTIGAVKFDPATGTLGETFYRRLGYDVAAMFGTVSDSTLQWWNRQAPHVREESFNGSDCPVQSAHDLATFCSGASGVWGNGATFDISILDHWYNTLGINTPWLWNVRDCRTLEDVARHRGILRKQFTRRGDHHNALDDAIYQSEYISGMWRGVLDL